RNFSKTMPPEDWELLKKIGNGYHDLTYEEYRKNPSKWNKFNSDHAKFVKWISEQTTHRSPRDLIKFSEKIYIALDHNNQATKIEIWNKHVGKDSTIVYIN